MIRHILTITLLFFLTSLVSQTELTSAIKGTIIDKESQSPLIGVNVVLIGSDPIKGTITDFNGEFRLDNIPVGRQSIQLSFIGYKPRTLNNLLIKSAKDLEINVDLAEDFSKLKEVIITGNDDKRKVINKMNTVSSRTISIEEATRFSGSLQDPARMAQNYAGVSGASDDRNDIIIRGNSPLGVLWRLEGIDIPSPNHFSTIGATGGPISMLNINNLKNSEFLTSAWSAEYGNATSGVFDLQMRKGNHYKREHMIQMGMNGFELGAEGPFIKDKRASYMFNYRYSTLGVFSALGIDLGVGDAIPEYQDLTMKLDFPTKKAGIFSLWGIGGFSSISFDADSIPDPNNLFADETESAIFGSKTGVIGLTHKYFINDNTFTKLVLTANAVQSSGDIDSVDVYTGYRSKRFIFDRVVSRYSFHAKINQKINSQNSWNAGIIGNLFNINFFDSARVNNTLIEQSDFKGTTTLFQGYVQWKHSFNELTSVNLGAHTQHFSLSNSTIIEPRIGVTHQLNEKNKLTFGVGHHSQTQAIVTYFVKKPNSTELPNKSLGLTKSAHIVLGYEIYLGKNARLKSEIYFQNLYNLPVEDTASSFSMANQGADFGLPNKTNLVNKGTGINYGIEITFEKFMTKGFYYLATASVFESKYKGSDNIERNTAFNSNYVVNVLAGKEFNINQKWTFTVDGKFTTSGGKPYTPIDLNKSQLYQTEIRDNSLAFSERHKEYFRFDFKIGFRKNGKKVSHEFFFDIQNITNQKNIFIQGYKTSTGKIATSYQRGFFPVFLYKLYF